MENIVILRGYIDKENGFTESTEIQTHDKHFSINNKYIQKVGTNEIYAEAIDLLVNGECPYTYEETDIEIEKFEEFERSEV